MVTRTLLSIVSNEAAELFIVIDCLFVSEKKVN